MGLRLFDYISSCGHGNIKLLGDGLAASIWTMPGYYFLPHLLRQLLSFLSLVIVQCDAPSGTKQHNEHLSLLKWAECKIIRLKTSVILIKVTCLFKNITTIPLFITIPEEYQSFCPGNYRRSLQNMQCSFPSLLHAGIVCGFNFNTFQEKQSIISMKCKGKNSFCPVCIYLYVNYHSSAC